MHAFWEYIRKVDSDGKFKIMMNDCFSENNGNWKFLRSLEQVNIYISDERSDKCDRYIFCTYMFKGTYLNKIKTHNFNSFFESY